MGYKSNKKDIPYYFSEGRHHGIEIIFMCHKSARRDNLATASANTIYITTYNGGDLIDNFKNICICKLFLKVIENLSCNHFICAHGIAERLRYCKIKFDKNDNSFIIIDRDRILLYD